MCVRLGQDVLDGLLDGVDVVGILVGNLDAELLLDGHDDLDGVEAVEAEVVGEVSGALDVGWVVDLIEALQQAEDAALDLLLVQATGRSKRAHGQEVLHARDNHRSSPSRRRAGNDRTDGSAGGGRGHGAKDGGAEHFFFFVRLLG